MIFKSPYYNDNQYFQLLKQQVQQANGRLEKINEDGLNFKLTFGGAWGKFATLAEVDKNLKERCDASHKV